MGVLYTCLSEKNSETLVVTYSKIPKYLKRVNLDKLGLFPSYNMTVTAFNCLIDVKLQLHISLKLEIHGVGGKTCQKLQRMHTFNIQGHVGGKSQLIFS